MPITTRDAVELAERIKRAREKAPELDNRNIFAKNWEGAVETIKGIPGGLLEAGRSAGLSLAGLLEMPGTLVGAAAAQVTGDAKRGAEFGDTISPGFLTSWLRNTLMTEEEKKQFKDVVPGLWDWPFMENRPESFSGVVEAVRRDLPILVESGESLWRSAQRMGKPDMYLREAQKGSLFPAVLEDAANVGSFGRGIGKPLARLPGGVGAAGEAIAGIASKIEAAPGRLLAAPFRVGDWARLAAAEGLGKVRVDPETVKWAYMGETARRQKPLGRVGRFVGSKLADVYGAPSLHSRATRNLRGVLLTEPGALAAEALKDVDLRKFANTDPVLQEAAVLIATIPDSRLITKWKSAKAAMEKQGASADYIAANLPFVVSDEAAEIALRWVDSYKDPLTRLSMPEDLREAVETVEKVQHAHAREYARGTGEVDAPDDIAPEELDAMIAAAFESGFDNLTLRASPKENMRLAVVDERASRLYKEKSAGLRTQEEIDQILSKHRYNTRLQVLSGGALTSLARRVLNGDIDLSDVHTSTSYEAIADFREFMRWANKVDDVNYNKPPQVAGLTDKQLNDFEKFIASGDQSYLDALRLAGKKSDESLKVLARTDPRIGEIIMEDLRRRLTEDPEWWAPSTRTMMLWADRLGTTVDPSQIASKSKGFVPLLRRPVLSDESQLSFKYEGGFRDVAEAMQSEPLEAVRQMVRDISDRYLAHSKRRLANKLGTSVEQFVASSPEHFPVLVDVAKMVADRVARQVFKGKNWRESLSKWRENPDLELLTGVTAKNAIDRKVVANAFDSMVRILEDPQPRAAEQLAELLEFFGLDDDEFRVLRRVAEPLAKQQDVWALDPETLRPTSMLQAGERMIPKALVDAVRDVDVIPNRPAGINKALELHDRVKRAWVGATLFMRPSWQVGNLVGNIGMLAPFPGAVPRFFTALKRGVKEKIGMETEPLTLEERMVTGQGLVQAAADLSAAQRRALGGETYAALQSVASTPSSQLLMSKHRGGVFGRVGAVWDRFIQTMGELNSVVDDAAHQAALHYAMDVEGLSGLDAVRRANAIAGDARNLSRFEREAVKRVATFYPWIRHMLRLGGLLLRERPELLARAAWLSQVSRPYGSEERGAFPGWLAGAIPFGGKYYRVPWNPWETTVEANPLFSTDVFAVSPIIQGVGAFAGLNVTRGRAYQAAPGEPEAGPRAALNAFLMQFPQYRMVRQAQWPNVTLYDSGAPRFSEGAPVRTLMKTDPGHQVLSYLTGVSEIDPRALQMTLVNDLRADVDDLRRRKRQEALEEFYQRRRELLARR